ncbi:hypothetical protein SH580_18440 [Coraliomargarita algicola]|uniref:Uncharacterized protein n=2 Tax=Coraliomargaritaceae TaxID=3056371 RepID=A0ABZ0RH82_9BACT|nr:hypothetical protein [Coraliomargarita sp. J2-16]WPJ95402.1 hypothetical protein SH580_18440 [Coraliomargarita sp. J2-16]
MKLRFTIILGYTTMFLWIWMLSELESTDLSEKVTRTIPMCGMMGTMWLIYRLECMAKEKKKKDSESSTRQTTINRANET